LLVSERANMATTNDWPAFTSPRGKSDLFLQRSSPAEVPFLRSQSSKFSCQILTAASELRPLAAELGELSAAASEPNVFYEPWMLLPALDSFAQSGSFRFVCITATDHRGARLLCGFFPFEVTDRYARAPLRTARLWNYLSFQWCVPLVRKKFEGPVFQTLLRWSKSNDFPCDLLELPSMPMEGPNSTAAIEELNSAGLVPYVRTQFTRALLENIGDAENMLRSAIPGHKLKDYRRLERRLSDRGEVAYEELDHSGDVDQWIEGFLALESAGWKGAAGSAIACNPASRTFFTRATKSAFQQQQLMMLRLTLNGRPIAYKCNFLRPPGSFSFKIAYDEEYRAFSPGVLLELENIRVFQRRCDLQWMDSCADPGHFMANHLWKGRRSMQSWLVAPRSGLPELAVAAMPLAKWAMRRVKSLIAIHPRRSA